MNQRFNLPGRSVVGYVTPMVYAKEKTMWEYKMLSRKQKTRKEENSMKRLSCSVLTGLLMASFSLQALSQAAQKPADPCAQFRTAPKGETAADKKRRRAELKACTDKEKASKQTKKKGAK